MYVKCGLVSVVLLLASLSWGQSIFDMPRLFPQHRMYLSQFITAAQKNDLFAAEVAARSAVKLFPKDANWNYNVACVCAKDKRAGEALEWLEKAIDLGFTNTEQILADGDLKSLHTSDRFKALIEKAKELAANPPTNPTLSSALISKVTMGQTAEVTTKNTQWDWHPQSGGYMQSLFQPLKPEGDTPAYTGPYADIIQPWIEEGSAAGNAGDFYVNRDEDRTQVRYEAFPYLTPVLYSEEAVSVGTHLGAANGLFLNGFTSIPTVGNSALTMRQGSPFWRSIPRMYAIDAAQNAVALRLAISNQLYLYDVTPDYHAAFKGDLLISNTPQFIMTADTTSEKSNPIEAQQQMTELVLAALAAMEPETKQIMMQKGLMVQTMQRLLRQHLKSEPGYLTAAAHPIAFDPAQIDGEALVRAAHTLRPVDLPPTFHIITRQETMPKQMVDYFDLFPSEGIADTPMCITRVHRGMNKTRKLTVEAASAEPGIVFKWFLVSGEAEKVRIQPLTKTGTLVTLEVDHHGLFKRNGMPTRRVDIACVAVRKDGTVSAPAFVSIRNLGHERRSYHINGKIAEVDYTVPEAGYIYEDPALSAFKNWKDTYHYDAQGKLTGWTRTRPEGTSEDFDALGRKILERNEAGQPTRVQKVNYLPRTLPESNGITAPFVELIQTDSGEPFQVTP